MPLIFRLMELFRLLHWLIFLLELIIPDKSNLVIKLKMKYVKWQ